MEPKQTMSNLQLQVALAQEDIKELQGKVHEAEVFIRGNGDPTKGLLWVAANAQAMNAALAQLIEAETKALKAHIKEHDGPAASLGQKLLYEALRQVVVASIMIVLTIFALGVVTFVRTGKVL